MANQYRISKKGKHYAEIFTGTPDFRDTEEIIKDTNIRMKRDLTNCHGK